jgi:hypothetical protein
MNLAGNTEVVYGVVLFLVQHDLEVASVRNLRRDFRRLRKHIHHPQQENQARHQAGRKYE